MPDEFKFAIQSQSSADVYELRVFSERGRLFVSCSCPAGAYGFSICKHRISILRGESLMLVAPIASAAAHGLARVQELAAQTILGQLIVDLAMRDEQVRAAQLHVKTLKQQLNVAMEEGSPIG